MQSTNDVINHHLEAINRGDVDAVMSDYGPDAVLFRQDGVFKAIDKIRPVLGTFIGEFRKPGTTFNTKQRLVDGDYAYHLWSAETADNFYELATDTYVVKSGKIVAQSFTAKITPKK